MARSETRLARAAAADADTEWKRHAASCPRCSRLARERSAEPCAAGAGLRDNARSLRTIAKREAELDKQVPEGQEALF